MASFFFFFQYGDELYPVETEGEGEDEEDNDNEDDLEASIAKEVAALKKPKGRKRFANITTGTDCGKNLIVFSAIQDDR